MGKKKQRLKPGEIEFEIEGNKYIADMKMVEAERKFMEQREAEMFKVSVKEDRSVFTADDVLSVFKADGSVIDIQFPMISEIRRTMNPTELEKYRTLISLDDTLTPEEKREVILVIDKKVKGIAAPKGEGLLSQISKSATETKYEALTAEKLRKVIDEVFSKNEPPQSMILVGGRSFGKSFMSGLGMEVRARNKYGMITPSESA